MKSVNYIIFGGSGYIGCSFAYHIINQGKFDKVYLLDIKEPEYYKELLSSDLRVQYFFCDVRNEISTPEGLKFNCSDWIINLAAVHREPGHAYHEYFDTNIPGARNVCEFANKHNIRNILFTSSIAPYGRSLDQRDESSNLYPETAYGISKAMAEEIHRSWLKDNSDNRLIIVRPSVIFGPNDPGNVYRMIKSLKKGTFVLPDGGKVVKGYGYIYGLVESMFFTMSQKSNLIIYNYAENPTVPLNEMVQIAKGELNINIPTFSINTYLLSVVASILQVIFKLFGKKTDIHPVRVRKAGFPTNIRPTYLIENGFEFKYDFLSALRHWRKVNPKDFE